MNYAASFLIALSVAGCSTNHSTLKPSLDSPKVIYAVPQSEAFSVAQQAILSAPRRATLGEYQVIAIHDHDATHNQLIGYRLVFQGWHYFNTFTQNLYVIPVAGVGVGGLEISGFRFLITGSGPAVAYLTADGAAVGIDFVRAAAQDTSLAKTLNAALGSTGTTTFVTNLRVRPYDEDGDR